MVSEINIQRRVGWFLLAGAVLLLLILVFVTSRSNMFAKHFDVLVEPPSAESFYEGQKVYFHGFQMGYVSDIRLLNSGQVQVHLKLLDQYRTMIHQGAILKLNKQGVIGEMVASLTSGDSDKPVLNDGGKIDFETEVSLDMLLEQLKPAVDHANVLLGEMAELAQWMNDPYGDLRVALAQFRDASSGIDGRAIQLTVTHLNQTLQSLNQVAESLVDSHVSAQLSSSLQTMSDILEGIKPLSDQIGKQGPEALQNINDLIKRVDALSKSLQLVSSDLSGMTPELPLVSREAREAIYEMKELVKSLRQTWLAGNPSQTKESASDTMPVAAPVMP